MFQKGFFGEGFPGVEDLFEWFGIRFEGQIYIPEDCNCKFRLSSDDGAILTIGDMVVVDNDGLHPTRSKDGEIFLQQGLHDFRIDYYQGPRYHIALQLLWSQNDGPMTIVSPDNFYR